MIAQMPHHTPISILVTLASLTGILAATAIAAGDYLSLVLVVAIPAMPFALIAGVRALRGDAIYALALAVIIIVIQSANFRYREYADKTIDFQIALKLASIAFLFALSVPTLLRRLNVGMPKALLVWFLLLTYLVFTSAYAANIGYSFLTSVSMLGGFCYLLHLLEAYGRQRLMWVMLVSGLILCLASALVYFMVPSFGRMSDWIGNTYVVTSRLQGVFGSSNAAGVSGAFCVLIAILMLDISWRRPLFWLMLVASTFCFVQSNNRMAIAAAAFAFYIVFMARGDLKLKCALTLIGASVLLVLLLSAGDLILERLSRSGSSEEVLSATGRTRVWAVVLDLWRERPLFGFGYTSAQQILPNHPLLFVAAAHTHNMYLEILFSGGVIGLGLLITSLATTLVLAIRRHVFKELALITFFLIYGITEPILSGPIGFPSFSFFTAVLLVFANEPEHLLTVPPAEDSRQGTLGTQSDSSPHWAEIARPSC